MLRKVRYEKLSIKVQGLLEQDVFCVWKNPIENPRMCQTVRSGNRAIEHDEESQAGTINPGPMASLVTFAVMTTIVPTEATDVLHSFV